MIGQVASGGGNLIAQAHRSNIGATTCSCENPFSHVARRESFPAAKFALAGMTLALAVVGAALAQTAATSPATPQPAPPTIESLLRESGIDPRDVGIHETDLALLVGRRPRSELAHLLITEPLRADGMARVIAELLSESAAKNPVETLAQMSRFNTRVVRRGLVGDPIAKQREAARQSGAFLDALKRCNGGNEPQPQSFGQVPIALEEAAALILNVTLTERDRFDPALREIAFQAGRTYKEWIEPLNTGEQEQREDAEPKDTSFERARKEAAEILPIEPLMIIAQDMMIAVHRAVSLLRPAATMPCERFFYSVETDLGWVVLGDGWTNNHTYDGPTLLIIDLGGNDTYRNAGASGGLDDAQFFPRPRWPISVAIDLGGNDVYEAEPNQLGSFGAGTFGVGILWDESGDDRYVADRRSQGCGTYGVGVLIDNAGNDTYKSIDASQASATAGYGLLIDRGGDDRYESYRNSQAFAGPNAAAALIDLGGNDTYIANDSDIRYPSPQSKEHNGSMCQAAATGERADYVDGLSINGGVAVLLDAAGDDEYSCGVFGQGVGYWYGAGLLIDLAGKDSYLGQWYAQGASAHFAAGLLFDRGGDDHYVAKMNMAQGAGHDTGIGVLIDDAGDDVYEAPTLSLGASNDAGLGLFIDKSGDDRYQTPNVQCVGWVNPATAYRSLFRSYGLFFDLAGRDEYTGRADASDARRWRSPPPSSQPANETFMFGLGFDR